MYTSRGQLVTWSLPETCIHKHTHTGHLYDTQVFSMPPPPIVPKPPLLCLTSITRAYCTKTSITVSHVNLWSLLYQNLHYCVSRQSLEPIVPKPPLLCLTSISGAYCTKTSITVSHVNLWSLLYQNLHYCVSRQSLEPIVPKPPLLCLTSISGAYCTKTSITVSHVNH